MCKIIINSEKQTPCMHSTKISMKTNPAIHQSTFGQSVNDLRGPVAQNKVYKDKLNQTRQAMLSMFSMLGVLRAELETREL